MRTYDVTLSIVLSGAYQAFVKRHEGLRQRALPLV